MVYNEEIKQELLKALGGAEHFTNGDIDVRGNSEFFSITINYGKGMFVSFYMDEDLGNALSVSSNYGGSGSNSDTVGNLLDSIKDIKETYWENGVYTGVHGDYNYKVKISAVRLVEKFKLYGLSAFDTLESLGA